MFSPQAGHTMSSQQISRGGNHENSDGHPDGGTENNGQNENNKYGGSNHDSTIQYPKRHQE